MNESVNVEINLTFCLCDINFEHSIVIFFGGPIKLNKINYIIKSYFQKYLLIELHSLPKCLKILIEVYIFFGKICVIL